MEFLEPLVDLVKRAIELEGGSPVGVTNLVFFVILAIAFGSLLVHEVFLSVIDLGKSVLYVFGNLIGRVWAHRAGADWKDFKDENPPPRRTAGWKLLTVLAAFAIACPFTLALQEAAL